jgi:ribosome biogenesis GTPase
MAKHRAHDGREDWTRRFQQDQHDDDHLQKSGRFSKRSKFANLMRIRRTTELRRSSETAPDLDQLPVGVVAQVYSLFVEVLHGGRAFLATQRGSVRKIHETDVVAGDEVRFRESGAMHESGRPEAVIEAVLPRRTVLLRADSFKQIHQHPIVANAHQMLIVASVLRPRVKWGLIDRMLIAASSGGLAPLLCLNKMDLLDPEAAAELRPVLDHYIAIGVPVFEASVPTGKGLAAVVAALAGKTTVLAGHSGVGKSSLIRAIAPALDIKVGDISGFNEKGRHTTTSAKRYELPSGDVVIDTPGVRHFGLWNVTPENLESFFPDVAAGDAPEWRTESYERILASLAET